MHEYVSSLQPSYSYQSSDSTFTFNSVLRGKLLAVVFQVEHDFCSLLNAGGFSNLKNPRAEGDHVKYWGLHFWFTAALLKPRIPLYSHSLTHLRTTCIQVHQAQTSECTRPRGQTPWRQSRIQHQTDQWWCCWPPPGSEERPKTPTVGRKLQWWQKEWASENTMLHFKSQTGALYQISNVTMKHSP